MGKIWFTSDTHFGSDRTLKLSKRPFTNVKEMDEYIIEQWNKVVGEDDIVYHLGDFGDYNMIEKLNGKVILICGNYELRNEQFKRFSDFKDYLINLGFKEAEPFNKTIVDNNKEYFLCHKPSEAKLIKAYNDCYCLFGHIHKLQMVKRYGLNVGVDCHNFKPISLDEVDFYLNAIDKHYDDEVFI